MSPLPTFNEALKPLKDLLALHNRLSGQATVKAHLKELIAQQIEALCLSNKGTSLDLIPSEILLPLLAIRDQLLAAGCPVDELDKIIIKPLKTMQEEIGIGCNTPLSNLDLLVDNSRSLTPTNGGELLPALESTMIKIIDCLYKDIVKALKLKNGNVVPGSREDVVPQTPKHSSSSDSGNETDSSSRTPVHQNASPLLGRDDPPDVSYLT